MSAVINGYTNMLVNKLFIEEWNMPIGDFRIKMYGGATYNYKVNWGDGSPISTVTSSGDPNATHTYSVAGIYWVSIEGTFSRQWMCYGTYCTQLLKVINWGDVGWTTFLDFASGATNLTWIPPKPIDYASGVTVCQNMFEDTGLTYIPGNLFSLMPNVTDYLRCFCNIGASLKGNAPALWDLDPEPEGGYCFYNDTNLANYASIPDDWKIEL
jgi:hypothetical protein